MPDIAHVDWRLYHDYAAVGGREAIQEAVREAVAQTPREHLRQLDTVTVEDRDPQGKSLGLWRRDAHGFTIEIYAEPHLTEILRAPAAARSFALRLYLAHTFFHEVGHHVTLHLNRRAEPPRKKAQVHHTLEKWAEQYVAKRLQRLCDGWIAPGGPAASAPESRQALSLALRFLGLDGQIRLAESSLAPPGTIPEAGSSKAAEPKKQW